jgi:transcriptional regulator with XRE-family HTH domain
LYNRIDSIRKEKEMSYGDIAKLSGCSASYVWAIAQGIRDNPSVDTMEGIARALREKPNKVFILEKGD